MIRYLLQETEISQIILAPSFSPPHKQNEVLAPFAHRFEIIRLSINHLFKDSLQNKRLVLSDIEAELATPSYTYETLKKLQIKLKLSATRLNTSDTNHNATISSAHQKQTEKKRLKIILGSDMYQTIHSWHKSETLSKEFGFIVANREGLSCQMSENDIQPVCSEKIIYLSNPQWNYNSRSIRQRIKEYTISQDDKERERIKQFLPEEIFEYIFTHQLYF